MASELPHEVNKIDLIPDDIIRGMIPEDKVIAHRNRGPQSQQTFVRGTAQNPMFIFRAGSFRPFLYSLS